MPILGTTVVDFLGNVVLSGEDGTTETTTVSELVQQLATTSARCAWMDVARHTVVGYVIAGLQRSPIRVVRPGQEGARGHEEWLWNVRPNPNQSHSEFVARLVDQMFFGRQKMALVVPARDGLWVADGWVEDRTRAGRPHTFSSISIEGSTEVVRKTMRADEVLLFRVPETAAWRGLMNAMGDAYDEMAKSATEAFADKNARRYLLRMDNPMSGTTDQSTKVNTYLKEYVGPFIQGTDAAMPLFRGMDLARLAADYSGGESTLDVVQIRKEAFETVANCMRVPVSFLEGNVNNFETVFEAFLAFAIDPIAKAIEDEIAAKQLSEREWAAGGYARVDTTHVRHVDLFAVADKVEKLVGSSIDTPNEIRAFTGQEPVRAPGMDEYHMTKNHDLAGGGDSNDKTQQVNPDAARDEG